MLENEAFLREEETLFEKAEEQMYKLFGHREEIRLRNCVVRTKIQRDHTLKKVAEMIAEFEYKEDEYNNVKAEFDSLEKSVENFQILIDINISLEEFVQQVNVEYSLAKLEMADMPDDSEFSTSEARNKVDKLLTSIKDRIVEFVKSRSRELERARNSKEVTLWLNAIHNLSSQYVPEEMVCLDVHVEDCNVEVNPNFNVEDYVRSKRTIFHPFRKHCRDDMQGYYRIVRDRFCGVQSDDYSTVGYIEDKLYKNVQKVLLECKSSILSDIVNTINGEIKRLKQAALSTIIPDYNVFCNDLDKLKALKEVLDNLCITINTKDENE